MTPIALTIIGSADQIPRNTMFRLKGQRLESTATSSSVSPGPLHPHYLVLTKNSQTRLRDHQHKGQWILTASHGTIVLVKPAVPLGRLFPYSDRMPTPPGVQMQRPHWTTFTRETIIDYHDGPRAILKEDRHGQTYLALWRQNLDHLSRWLHIPLNPADLKLALTGAVSIASIVYAAEFVFFVDQQPDGAYQRTTMTVPDLIPDGHPITDLIPAPGQCLSYPPQIADEWLRDRPLTPPKD